MDFWNSYENILSHPLGKKLVFLHGISILNAVLNTRRMEKAEFSFR